MGLVIAHPCFVSLNETLLHILVLYASIFHLAFSPGTLFYDPVLLRSPTIHPQFIPSCLF